MSSRTARNALWIALNECSPDFFSGICYDILIAIVVATALETVPFPREWIFNIVILMTAGVT